MNVIPNLFECNPEKNFLHNIKKKKEKKLRDLFKVQGKFGGK
jgi:hypothetical protein